MDKAKEMAPVEHTGLTTAHDDRGSRSRATAATTIIPPELKKGDRVRKIKGQGAGELGMVISVLRHTRHGEYGGLVFGSPNGKIRVMTDTGTALIAQPAGNFVRVIVAAFAGSVESWLVPGLDSAEMAAMEGPTEDDRRRIWKGFVGDDREVMMLSDEARARLHMQGTKRQRDRAAAAAVAAAAAKRARAVAAAAEWEAYRVGGVAPMSTARWGLGVAVVDSKLYVVGGGVDGVDEEGWVSSRTVSSVEGFDPSTGQWSGVAPMSTARDCHGVAVVDGKLYAMGGWDGTNTRLSSMECYDPSTG